MDKMEVERKNFTGLSMIVIRSPVKDLITRIFEVQNTNLHSDRNIYFNIHNREMMMSDYIDIYFKR